MILMESTFLNQSAERDPVHWHRFRPTHASPAELLLQLLLPSSSKHEPSQLRFPLERESLPPHTHISTPVAFQHLWPGGPNGAVGNPNFRAQRSISQ
ncbi:hypothetical protein AVEN_187439-1 [Araneus ventricosus]|uniref:Uncharacterized protein n=1 Tax=Araneus ventricosus TaxID=182803 RepID=A0A4Y2BS88_ARAVE|nr:hypothetical protein AVEN_187439-1 [Araneus ventricosus]